MVNLVECEKPDLKSIDLKECKIPKQTQQVPTSHDVFDFIGDWILKDFLEHEAG